MTIKEKAIQIIDHLPPESSMDDIMKALYIQTKFNHGQDELNTGKGIPHDQVVKMLRTWQT